jgi:hypothetical protein
MELRILSPDPKYAPPVFMQPTQSGWLHLAATVAVRVSW